MLITSAGASRSKIFGKSSRLLQGCSPQPCSTCQFCFTHDEAAVLLICTRMFSSKIVSVKGHVEELPHWQRLAQRFGEPLDDGLDLKSDESAQRSK